MNRRITPLRLVLAGLLFLLPTLVLVLLSKGLVYDSERGLIRFANAFLTSYTLASLFLVLNMFQYSRSRRQPTAPWVSMAFAAILGVLVTFLLTTQGSFLMEENGSQRAQILYNIIHFIVTSLAIIVAIGIMVLLSFVNLEPKEQNKS